MSLSRTSVFHHHRCPSTAAVWSKPPMKRYREGDGEGGCSVDGYGKCSAYSNYNQVCRQTHYNKPRDFLISSFTRKMLFFHPNSSVAAAHGYLLMRLHLIYQTACSAHISSALHHVILSLHLPGHLIWLRLLIRDDFLLERLALHLVDSAEEQRHLDLRQSMLYSVAEAINETTCPLL